MEKSDLKFKVITIVGLKIKGDSTIITDQDNKNYYLNKTKKDGSPTMAYMAWEDMQLRNGSTIKAGYEEIISKKTGEPYNSIRKLERATPLEMENVVPFKSKEEIKTMEKSENDKWDKISYGKCKHAFLVECFKLGMDLDEAELKSETWASASMRQLSLDEMKDLEISNVKF